MYLSCTTCALRGRGRDEIEETFRYARAAGYRHWGLGGPFTYIPGLIQWLDVAQVRQRMAQAGLESLTEVWSPPIPTESPEAALLGAEQVAMAGRAAAQLGCRIVVQTGGARRDGGLRQTVTGLSRALELLRDLPVVIALEPHVQSQILWPEDYGAIFADLANDKVGITVDVGHFHSAGVDWKALIRRYPERIFNVHLKDHIGPQSVAIGRGEIDLKGLVAVLREIGYAGPIALELEVTDPENLPRYVQEAQAYMTALLA
jgi:sugar phosphate isomerase/epimerase